MLNGSPHVTEATKERVLTAIKELDYRQTRGGAVRHKPRRQVGVLVPFIEQPATYQRLQALVRRLQPHGFDVVVMHVDSPQRARERVYELPRHPHLSGLVVGADDDFSDDVSADGRADVLERVRLAFRYAERPNRFVYGSDWPLAPMPAYAAFIRQAIQEDFHDMVFDENARKVFGDRLKS